MTANEQPASDQAARDVHAAGGQESDKPAPAHNAEPYVIPPPGARRYPVETTTAAAELMGLTPSITPPITPADNCGDPECPCTDPDWLLAEAKAEHRRDRAAGYAAAPTAEPDREPAPRRRWRRRYDPAAVLAVMLAGVQVGRAVRHLVDTIRVVQESGGLV